MYFSNAKGLDKPLSRLVLGTLNVNEGDTARRFRLLDEAFELGFTTLDTANACPGESTIGRWMAERGNRQDVFIIGKGCHPNEYRSRVTPTDIEADLNESLSRLQTDTIDLYMLHRDDTTVPVEYLIDALNKQIRSGKVRAIGASNWTARRIADANAYARSSNLAGFVASSPHISLVEQYTETVAGGGVSVSGNANRLARLWYAAEQMPVLVYYHEPIFRSQDRAIQFAAERGISISQLAIATILRDPMNMFPVINATGSAEMKEMLKALDIRLSDDEADWLNLEKDQYN